MPSRLKIRVIEAQDLRSDHKIDAFVEVRHGESQSHRTRTVYRSNSPAWRENFTIDILKDKRLLDSPVEFKLWNYNSMTSDFIGSTLVVLHPLLRGKLRCIDGWFPLFDCLKGIRGWLHVAISLDLIKNESQFAETAYSIRFFASDTPSRYHIGNVHGLVEELVVEDDPEFHWNKFRASRTTNDQRLLLMYHVSGKLRRKLALKVQEMGGNAVLKFSQHFDFEGEGGGGIVARAYGTAVTLVKKDKELKGDSTDGSSVWAGLGAINRMGALSALGGSPLLTLMTLPTNILFQLGGLVVARSVKLVKTDHRRKNHDKWWCELRAEIHAHTRKLGCNMVMGYSETSTVLDDICVLTASGTACYRQQDDDHKDGEGLRKSTKKRKKKKKKKRRTACYACHIPYSSSMTKLPLKVRECLVCKKKLIPEIILASIDLPHELSIEGEAQIIQSRVCMAKRKQDGESGATSVSEKIPFLEYELHSDILRRLQTMQCNAVFGLKTCLSIGDSMITIVATGTAVKLSALPIPNSVDSRSEGLDHVDDIEVSEEGEASAFTYFKSDESMTSEQDDHRLVLVSPESPDAMVHTPIELPPGVRFATVEKIPQQGESRSCLWNLTAVYYERLSSKVPIDSALINRLFTNVIDNAAFKLFGSAPCTLYGANFRVLHPGENDVQIILTGTVLADAVEPIMAGEQTYSTMDELTAPLSPKPGAMESDIVPEDDLLFEMEQDPPAEKPHISIRHTYQSVPVIGRTQQSSFAVAPVRMGESSVNLLRDSRRSDADPLRDTLDSLPTIEISKSTGSTGSSKAKNQQVILTSLSYVAGAKNKRYCGHVGFHLIKERLDRRASADEVAYTFLYEAIALARAHVLAIGGNALVSFSIETLAMNESTNYCLLSISGDVLVVSMKGGVLNSSIDSLNEPVPLGASFERSPPLLDVLGNTT